MDAGRMLALGFWLARNRSDRYTPFGSNPIKRRGEEDARPMIRLNALRPRILIYVSV
jgi:hypothetical protein